MKTKPRLQIKEYSFKLCSIDINHKLSIVQLLFHQRIFYQLFSFLKQYYANVIFIHMVGYNTLNGFSINM